MANSKAVVLDSKYTKIEHMIPGLTKTNDLNMTAAIPAVIFSWLKIVFVNCGRICQVHIRSQLSASIKQKNIPKKIHSMTSIKQLQWPTSYMPRPSLTFAYPLWIPVIIVSIHNPHYKCVRVTDIPISPEWKIFRIQCLVLIVDNLNTGYLFWLWLWDLSFHKVIATSDTLVPSIYLPHLTRFGSC